MTTTLFAVTSLLVSLITSYYVTKEWMEVAKRRGLVGKDVNKPYEVYVPEAGGIGFVMGLSLGLLTTIALSVFVWGKADWCFYVLAALNTALMAAFIGFVDDVLGWKKGLSHRAKVLSTVPIAVPLMAVKAGVSVMCLPLVGCLNFGILYPLVLVPIGVVGATNAFNMVAGLNGLEAGMGTIIFLTLSILAIAHNNLVATVVSLASLGAILGFLYWNKYPARVFPGDVFTYSVGSMIAAVAILGNMEGAALILFVPYFLELLLYLYGKKNSVEKESWGKPVGNCLEIPYDKPYSITHLAMLILKKVRGCAREWEVVLLILAFEALLAVIALAMYL